MQHKSLNIGMSDGDAGMSSKNLAKSIEHDKVKEAILTDLRQQTDKFFMGGMQNNENFLPEIKDVILHVSNRCRKMRILNLGGWWRTCGRS